MKRDTLEPKACSSIIELQSKMMNHINAYVYNTENHSGYVYPFVRHNTEIISLTAEQVKSVIESNFGENATVGVADYAKEGWFREFVPTQAEMEGKLSVIDWERDNRFTYIQPKYEFTE